MVRRVGSWRDDAQHAQGLQKGVGYWSRHEYGYVKRKQHDDVYAARESASGAASWVGHLLVTTKTMRVTMERQLVIWAVSRSCLIVAPASGIVNVDDNEDEATVMRTATSSTGSYWVLQLGICGV